jgi:hypothetical protein
VEDQEEWTCGLKLCNERLDTLLERGFTDFLARSKGKMLLRT